MRATTVVVPKVGVQDTEKVPTVQDQQVIKDKNLGIAGVLNLNASGQGNIHNPTLNASLQMPQLLVRGQRLANLDLRTTVANHVANFTLGEEAFEAPAGTIVHARPGTLREATAAQVLTAIHEDEL